MTSKFDQMTSFITWLLNTLADFIMREPMLYILAIALFGAVVGIVLRFFRVGRL